MSKNKVIGFFVDFHDKTTVFENYADCESAEVADVLNSILHEKGCPSVFDLRNLLLLGTFDHSPRILAAWTAEDTDFPSMFDGERYDLKRQRQE